MDRRMAPVGLVVVLALSFAGAGTVPGAPAQAEEAVDLNNPDAIRLMLESHSGKRVKLKLASGQEIEGKIAKVGAAVVVLTEVTGMEFFDATVRLDQVAAVLVRTRSR